MGHLPLLEQLGPAFVAMAVVTVLVGAVGLAVEPVWTVFERAAAVTGSTRKSRVLLVYSVSVALFGAFAPFSFFFVAQAVGRGDLYVVALAVLAAAPGLPIARKSDEPLTTGVVWCVYVVALTLFVTTVGIFVFLVFGLRGHPM